MIDNVENVDERSDANDDSTREARPRLPHLQITSPLAFQLPFYVVVKRAILRFFTGALLLVSEEP